MSRSLPTTEGVRSASESTLRREWLLGRTAFVVALVVAFVQRVVVVEAEENERRHGREQAAAEQHGLQLAHAPVVTDVEQQQHAQQRPQDHREVAHVVLDHERVRPAAVRHRLGEDGLHGRALEGHEEPPQRERAIEQRQVGLHHGDRREQRAHEPEAAGEPQYAVATRVVGDVPGGGREDELRDALHALDDAHLLVGAREHEDEARDELLEEDVASGDRGQKRSKFSRQDTRGTSARPSRRR